MTVQHPMLTTGFWSDALERAVSTAANSAATILTVGAFQLIGDVPWYAVLSSAGIAALLDLLRSLGAAGRGNPGTAGVTRAIEAANPDQPTLIARFATKLGR